LTFHSHYFFDQEATDPEQSPFSLKFTGHERDENGDVQKGVLDYMKARYCSPILGRFLRPDPVPPMRLAMGRPQLWNRYAYAAGNPIRFVDPEGLVITLPKDFGDELDLLRKALTATGAVDLANSLRVVDVGGVNQIAAVDPGLIDSANSTAGLIGGLINDTKNTVSLEIPSASLMSDGGAVTRRVGSNLFEIQVNPATVAQGMVWGRVLSGPYGGAKVLAPISAPTALVHELGHAQANARGYLAPPFGREGSENYRNAMRYENSHRRMLKGAESVERVNHRVYFPNDPDTWSPQ
jgi:RHS repeat-associated protein